MNDCITTSKRYVVGAGSLFVLNVKSVITALNENVKPALGVTQTEYIFYFTVLGRLQIYAELNHYCSLHQIIMNEPAPTIFILILPFWVGHE
jgi:hypothetical protein